MRAKFEALTNLKTECHTKFDFILKFIELLWRFFLKVMMMAKKKKYINKHILESSFTVWHSVFKFVKASDLALDLGGEVLNSL
jgi:hypothetical protein